MSPRLIDVTNKRTGLVETINPRRINRIAEVAAPSQQPELAGTLGTLIQFTKNDTMIVMETRAQIKRMLK